MQNGSVGAVMKSLAGKRNTYAYEADLLLANARNLVSWYGKHCKLFSAWKRQMS